MFITVLGISIISLYKNKDWATLLHEYYVSESKKHWYGKLFPWETPWVFWLFRVMVIFFGIVLLIGAYPLAFGTVYF